MVATLERRIVRLETTPPAPRSSGDGGDDGPPGWWHDAPAAVRRYFLTTDTELVAAGVHHDGEAVSAWLAARHPLWLTAWHEAAQAHTQGGALRRIQYEVLHGAFCRLKRAIVEGRIDGHAGLKVALPGSAMQRLTGVPEYGPRQPAPFYAGSQCYNDKSGAAWVAQWRRTGTREPADLALVGLHEAELALLVADEEG